MVVIGGGSDPDAYRRGQADGARDERLDGHDRHFAAINGQLVEVALRLSELVLIAQRLGDQADANARTVVATAAALEKAAAARRESAEQSWSPIQKVLAVILAAVAIGSLIIQVMIK